MKSFNPVGSLFCLVLLFFQGMLICSSASAQDDIPKLDNKCFNDHGHLLRKTDKAIIKSLCKKAQKKGVPMMVVTVGSVADFNTRPLSLDSFVSDIFDDWDIEYDQANCAILLFVSRKDHQIRIKLGDAYPARARKKALNVMVRTVGPSLRRRASSGIRKGFARLYKEVVRPYVRAQKRKEDAQKAKRGRVDFE